MRKVASAFASYEVTRNVELLDEADAFAGCEVDNVFVLELVHREAQLLDVFEKACLRDCLNISPVKHRVLGFEAADGVLEVELSNFLEDLILLVLLEEEI